VSSVRAEVEVEPVLIEFAERGPGVRQRSPGSKLVFEAAEQAKHAASLRHDQCRRMTWRARFL
jgi:hypothetical protein